MLTHKHMLWMMVVLFIIVGCSGQMANQSRVEPFEADGGARPLPPGVVPRVEMVDNMPLQTGMQDGSPVSEIPMTVDMTLLERGQERYDIFCVPCHGILGDGNGTVTQYGFDGVASFQGERLQNAPPGHFFDVITNGSDKMYSYASRIPVEDRWAIIAYIKALQFSQNAPIDQLNEQDREQLNQ